MSQALRIVLSYAAVLAAITFAHGAMNLGWLEDGEREQLVVGHLPVT